MKLATLCYIKDKKSGKTLMLHRVKKENDMHEGKWNGLGGKIEDGESPEQCVIREVKEESGLTIKQPKLKGFITFPAFDNIEDWYVFVFTADDFSGVLIDSDEGILEWIPDEKVTDLPLWEGDKVFLPWLNGGKIFSSIIRYDKGKFTGYEVIFY
jgi:8-oxo-dGTP diphosphatase